MKKEEIKIGGLYTMKVGKNTTAVRIMSQNEDGHWVVCNIKTNKEVVIKSANQLTGVYRTQSDKAAQVETHTDESSKTAKPKQEPTLSKTGILAAALLVLEEEGKPLNCPQMVKLMFEKGYWKTDAKTPAATLHSAISTEIKKKGNESRFRKTERGKFELVKQ
ncbi:MAG: hypothetical protein BWY69_00577 [Planctomycetes bacterium ADurb.Bin401]|nr:MAG: hypothetical protein BWY69_00577 [Planctomycetes bacterium ADurb.Bin401]